MIPSSYQTNIYSRSAGDCEWLGLHWRDLGRVMKPLVVDEFFRVPTRRELIKCGVEGWYLGRPIRVGKFPQKTEEELGELNVPPIIALAAPLVGTCWFALAVVVFRFELRNYQSAGH